MNLHREKLVPGLVVVLALQSSPALAADRWLLAIGNKDYGADRYDESWDLMNPVADAQAIAEGFVALGANLYRKKVFENLPGAGLTRVVSNFLKEHQGDSVVVYYAGHAVTLNCQGGVESCASALHLVGTDVSKEELKWLGPASQRERLARASVNISALLEDRQFVLRTSPAVFIIDACRNNFFRSAGAGELDEPSHRGLGAVAVPRGVYLAYSTSPGQRSRDVDDRDRNHSPFAAAMLGELARASQNLGALGDEQWEVDRFFRRVRVNVLERRSYSQVTWTEHSLVAPTYFLR